MSSAARPRLEPACPLGALGLLLCFFAAAAYRAAAQSITFDEARVFLTYIEAPLSRTLTSYDASQHVLETVLARWPVRMFGLSEFTFRLPSLLAAGAYLLAAFQLSRRLFGGRRMLPAAAAALGANLLMLEYLGMTRAFALAMALFTWGVYLLVRYISEDYDRPERFLPRAGLLFGLSVAANPAFVFPVAAAAAAFTAAARRIAFDRLWGPAIVPAFAFLCLPLLKAPGLADALSPFAGPGWLPMLALTAPVLLIPAAGLRRFSTVLLAGIPLIAALAAGFHELQRDVPMRPIVAALRDSAQGRHVRIAASPSLQPGIGFYRRMWRLDWLPARIGNPDRGEYDYYALAGPDRDLARKLSLAPVFADPAAEVTVARTNR